jgi:hypothetical protein
MNTHAACGYLNVQVNRVLDLKILAQSTKQRTNLYQNQRKSGQHSRQIAFSLTVRKAFDQNANRRRLKESTLWNSGRE